MYNGGNSGVSAMSSEEPRSPPPTQNAVMVVPQPPEQKKESDKTKQYRPTPKETRSEPRITLDARGRPILEGGHEEKEPGMAATAIRATSNLLVENAMLGMSPSGATDPTSLVLSQSSTAWLVMKQVQQASEEGYKTGSREAARRRKVAAFIPSGDIRRGGPDTVKQLVSDLVHLSANSKTTLDVNRRLNPAVVAERATRMIAQGSMLTTEIKLTDLGIRPTENLKDALRNYTRGGRKQLVASGIVPPTSEDEKKLAEEMSRPKNKQSNKETKKESENTSQKSKTNQKKNTRQMEID